ncbi:MAG: hypothetical protein JWO93_3331 [Micrococcaceae bacterium]|jgi:uncharacterized protein YeaO (DUF488 family)|nr:hypothetical protein [Micrococcaceae bacterium]
MLPQPSVQIRRVYAEPLASDGTRVLVDRLWPRGLTKERARLDQWCRDIAPTADLRKWYAHDPALFDEFSRRYRAELQSPAAEAILDRFRALAREAPLTLLTATKDPDISAAAVLSALIQQQPS